MADLNEQGESSSTSVPKFATIDLADYNEFTKRTLKSTSETMVAFRKREGKQPCDLCVRNGEECIPVDPGRGIRCALCSKRRKVCSWRGDILIPATALHYGISAEDATQLYEKWVEVQSKPVDKPVDKLPESNADKDAEEPGPSTPVAEITTKKPIFARKAFKPRRPGEFIFQLDSPNQSGNEAQPLTTSAPVKLTQHSSKHAGARSGVLVNPGKSSLGDATGANTSQSSNPAPPGKSATQPAKDSQIARKATTTSPKIRVPRRSDAAAAEASTRRGSEPPVSTVVSADSENPKRARKLTLKAQATLENQGLARKNPAGAKRKRDEPEGEPEAETSMAPREPPRPRPRLSKTKGRVGRPPKRRKLQATMEPVKVTLKVRRVSPSKHHKSQPEETQTDVEMQDDPQPSARRPILDGGGSNLSGDLEQRYSALEERYLKLCDIFAQGAIEAKAKDDRIKQLEEANQALGKNLKETTERLSQSEEINGA